MRLLSLSDLDSYRTTPAAETGTVRLAVKISTRLLLSHLYTERVARYGGKRAKTVAQARGRGSEDEKSETNDISGTSSEKLRLAKTRAELREAVQSALRPVQSYETFGPKPLHEEDSETEDEIEELRS